MGIIWAGTIAETRAKVKAPLGDGCVVTSIHAEDRARFDALPVLDAQGTVSYPVTKEMVRK